MPSSITGNSESTLYTFIKDSWPDFYGCEVGEPIHFNFPIFSHFFSFYNSPRFPASEGLPFGVILKLRNHCEKEFYKGKMKKTFSIHEF